MNSISKLYLSEDITFGTLAPTENALVRIFVSDFVRRVRIWLSRSLCLYSFGMRCLDMNLL